MNIVPYAQRLLSRLWRVLRILSLRSESQNFQKAKAHYAHLECGGESHRALYIIRNSMMKAERERRVLCRHSHGNTKRAHASHLARVRHKINFTPALKTCRWPDAADHTCHIIARRILFFLLCRNFWHAPADDLVRNWCKRFALDFRTHLLFMARFLQVSAV